MVLKAGLYDGTSDDMYSEIVRYCQAIDKPYLKKQNKIKNGIILYTCKDIMCPFQVKAQETIPYCYLESDTRFTKSGTHVWTHFWG